MKALLLMWILWEQVTCSNCTLVTPEHGRVGWNKLSEFENKDACITEMRKLRGPEPWYGIECQHESYFPPKPKE